MELYTWRTPNGRKVPILLAELGVPYTLVPVDIRTGAQKQPDYLRINPNGKIPALVDGDVRIFESGAILEYLAAKHGRFLPTAPAARAEVMAWLFWQVGGPGPTFGNLGHYVVEEKDNPRAHDRLFAEARRQIGVLDHRLRDREHVAGEYSIADIACYPWFVAVAERVPAALEDAEHVGRWMARLAVRPAVMAGMSICAA
jgi:GST-like protein